MSQPPEMIGGLPVVCYTPLDKRHRLTGHTRHYLGANFVGRLAGLAVVRADESSFYLFGCDHDWNPLTDTFHSSVEEAVDQAEFEYQGTRQTWATHHRASSQFPAFPCPACGFLVFDQPAGSYDICKVCGWEDDEVQLRFPGYGGGANVESLCEHQQEWLGAIPPEIQLHRGFRRSSGWRPLSPDECIDVPDDREPYIYYWHRPSAQHAHEGDEGPGILS